MTITSSRPVAAGTPAGSQPAPPAGNPSASAGSQPAPPAAAGPVRALRPAVRVATTLLLVLAAAAFLFLAVGPRVLGYQTTTMLTGSMSPNINPGDVVVTVRIPVAELHVGDVVTYNIPVGDHRVETHRVTEILSGPDGTAAIRTRGDANNGPDPWTAVLTSQVIDKHVFTIPYAGQAIRAMREPAVLNVLMYGAPAVLVVLVLSSIWQTPARPGANGQSKP